MKRERNLVNSYFSDCYVPGTVLSPGDTSGNKKEEKRMKRIEENLRDLWDNTKCTNIRIIGVPEEEEKKKGSEKIFEEIIVENFPNMGKEIVTQV